MKWRALAVLKVTGLAVFYLAALQAVNHFYPKGMVEFTRSYEVIVHLGYAFSMLAIALLTFVMAYFGWLDQKYRCRTCARKLRMPVATGSWGKATLFAPPHMEWICPFGHGTMREWGMHLTGARKDDWVENDDNFWKAFEDAWKKN